MSVTVAVMWFRTYFVIFTKSESAHVFCFFGSMFCCFARHRHFIWSLKFRVLQFSTFTIAGQTMLWSCYSCAILVKIKTQTVHADSTIHNVESGNVKILVYYMLNLYFVLLCWNIAELCCRIQTICWLPPSSTIIKCVVQQATFHPIIRHSQRSNYN